MFRQIYSYLLATSFNGDDIDIPDQIYILHDVVAIEKASKGLFSSPLVQEVYEHTLFGRQKCAVFYGREQVLEVAIMMINNQMTSWEHFVISEGKYMGKVRLATHLWLFI